MAVVAMVEAWVDVALPLFKLSLLFGPSWVVHSWNDITIVSDIIETIDHTSRGVSSSRCSDVSRCGPLSVIVELRVSTVEVIDKNGVRADYKDQGSARSSASCKRSHGVFTGGKTNSVNGISSILY